MTPPAHRHITIDSLRRFFLKTLSHSDELHLERHLDSCASCKDRVRASIIRVARSAVLQYQAAVRSALRN